MSEGERSWSWQNNPDGVIVEINHARRDEDGRQVYGWIITVPMTFSDEDLRSGVGAPIDAEEMGGTFASFLGAWVESRARQDRGEPSENHDLFPTAMWDSDAINVDWQQVADLMSLDTGEEE